MQESPQESIDRVIWNPTDELIEKSYVTRLMRKLATNNLNSLWRFSVEHQEKFWDAVMTDLGIEWFKPYEKVLDQTDGIEWSKWFIGGKVNIAHNCVDRHRCLTREAIVWESDDGKIRRLSYQQLYCQVNQTANALKSLGIKKGDTVGILMPMVPEVVVQLFAALKIGAVTIPIFSGFGAEAVKDRLKEAEAKVLFTSDVAFRRGQIIHVKKIADEAAKEVPSLRHTIVFQRGSERLSLSKHEIAWHEFISQSSTECETEELDSESPSLILFTSGTTGKPKGAIHTHAGCLAQVGKELRYVFNTDENSRFFWFTDIGWMMGPWEMIGVTLFGGTLFLYEGAPDYPAPDRLWQMIERHQLTTLGISPTAIRLLMKYGAELPNKHAMPSLQLLGSTGEPWDEQSYLWFFHHVGKDRCPIINISGGTEIIGCLLSPLPIQPLKPCSLGGPALGVDADVFDENGLPVRGGIGNLVCKKPIPSMTKGFLNAKQRYLDTYFGRWKGVWYHGDWARVDQDGYWFLHGRSDDTIKIAGKRIGPVEFEGALMKNSSVQEAAAIGVPDPIKGGSCVCFVVLKPFSQPTTELRQLLFAEIADALGKSLLPKEIKFSAELPKTRSAKILRGLIRKIYLNESITDTSSVENPQAIDAIRNAV